LGIFSEKRRKLPHKIPFLMFLGPNLANVLRFKNIGNNFPKKEKYCHIIFLFIVFGPNVGECFSKIKRLAIFF